MLSSKVPFVPSANSQASPGLGVEAGVVVVEELLEELAAGNDADISQNRLPDGAVCTVPSYEPTLQESPTCLTVVVVALGLGTVTLPDGVVTVIVSGSATVLRSPLLATTSSIA